MTTQDTRRHIGAGRVARWSRRGALLVALFLLGLLALPAAAAAAGTAKCTPNNAPVGTAINVAMAGLPAGQPVTVTTAGAGGTLTKQPLTTAADGTLNLDLDTAGVAPGDYTVQALDMAGTMLAQGRYTLTAAPSRLPSTGGGHAADATGRATLATTLALGTLALLGSAGLARRRARRATGR